MPRLNLDLLERADAATDAKHEHGQKFRAAYRRAQEFNANYKENSGYGEAEAFQQVKRLDDILTLAGEWLTAKPLKQAGGEIPRGKAQKNATRWQALATLCEECSANLIDMGFRPLSGHWMGNPLDQPEDQANYWLERLDPKHRGAPALRLEYSTWSTLPANHEHYGKSFFEFVDVTRRDLQTSVRYDKGTDEAEAEARRIRRRQSQLLIHDGKLYKMTDTGDRGDVFSSVLLNLKTEYAGPGFAIFVWDHKRRIYSGQHIANSLHHSTPRGGRPVRCAGELRTDNEGKLVMLTSKTGHYKTTPKEFEAFRQYLQENNALTDDTCCIPDTSNSGNGTWRAFAGLSKSPKTKAAILQAIPGLDTNVGNRNFWRRLAD